MAPKPTLTKSLHTITAVANVAQYLASSGKVYADGAANSLTRDALAILGYDFASFSKSDPTLQRCIAAVSKILNG